MLISLQRPGREWKDDRLSPETLHNHCELVRGGGDRVKLYKEGGGGEGKEGGDGDVDVEVGGGGNWEGLLRSVGVL